LLPHTFGAIFIAFTRVSAEFRAEVHDGDTLYPALQIVDLAPSPTQGEVTTDVTVHNQDGNLVLTGRHSYLLRR
jgi:acyl dehydratase